MAVTNTPSPGERTERVEERGDVAKKYGTLRAGRDSVPRDVKSGKGFVNVNVLSGDGSCKETSRLGFDPNTRDEAGALVPKDASFPDAAVTAKAVFSETDDKKSVMVIAPVEKEKGLPTTIDINSARFYAAEWDDPKQVWKRGAEIDMSNVDLSTDPTVLRNGIEAKNNGGTAVAANETAARAAESLQIMKDANTAKLPGAMVRPDFKQGGSLVVGALDDKQQPQRRLSGPSMHS